MSKGWIAQNLAFSLPLILLLISSPSTSEEKEHWTIFKGANGSTIRGQVIEFDETSVSMRVLQKNGWVQIFEFPLSKLAAESRLLVTNPRHSKTAGMPSDNPVFETSEEMDRLNSLAGAPLFDKSGLDDQHPDNVFKRLGLEEDPNGRHASLNSRFGGNLEIFGLTAREIEIHGRQGKGIQRISFLFSNMQTAENGLSGRDIIQETEHLITLFTKTIGEPKTFRNFSPPETELLLWQTEKIAFLMSHGRRQYIFLEVLPVGPDGKINYVPGNQPPTRQPVLSADTSLGIDVVLPAEVHRQGNMNCYPTAASIILNHAGILANPQMLGAASLTSEAGTYDIGLMGGISSILDELDNRNTEHPFDLKGRTLDTSTKFLSFDEITEFIDSGCPVFLSIYSLNTAADYVKNYERYRMAVLPDKDLERDLRRSRSRIEPGSGHSGTVLGYNREKNDVFFADPFFRIGWIEYDVLEDHLQGMYAVIQIE